MNQRTRFIGLAVAACGLLSMPALAGVAEQVQARIAGFRQLGADYKAVMDGARASDVAKIRQAAGRIGNASRGIYTWFPAGSGPRPGLKTAAKPDIWARGAQFRAAQDAFSREALAFQQAAAGGNIDAIRAEARKLGGTCKGCHDNFRVPSD